MCFRDNKKKSVDDGDMAVTMSNGKKVRNCSRSKPESARLGASLSGPTKELLKPCVVTVRNYSRSKPDSARLGASLSGPTKELLKPCVVRVRNCSPSNPGLARICASLSGPTKERGKPCGVNTRTSRTCSLSKLESDVTTSVTSSSSSTKGRLDLSLKRGGKSYRTCSLSNLDSAKLGASSSSSTKENLSKSFRKKRPSKTCKKRIPLMNEWLNGNTRVRTSTPLKERQFDRTYIVDVKSKLSSSHSSDGSAKLDASSSECSHDLSRISRENLSRNSSLSRLDLAMLGASSSSSTQEHSKSSEHQNYFDSTSSSMKEAISEAYEIQRKKELEEGFSSTSSSVKNFLGSTMERNLGSNVNEN